MNTTTTPEQEKKLQLALVKMLPEKLAISNDGRGPVFWLNPSLNLPPDREVLDTEWLHICWLIEQALTDNVLLVYESLLRGIVINDEDNTNRSEYTASWQQRALALCRVKGVEV